MAPEITERRQLDFLAESFDPETRAFWYTTFSKIQKDDSVYFGQLWKRKLDITPQEFTAALVRIPDEDVYPKFIPGDEISAVIPDPIPSHLYLKRPRLFSYEEYKEQGALSVIPAILREEASILEVLSKHPHRGIIKYHGCRVKRGFITGLALNREYDDLKAYINAKEEPAIDEGPFMAALECAVQHVHTLGFAHNDINPANVLLDEERMPVLTDFNSCQPIGQKLIYGRGTPGWIDPKDGWDTSEIRHDLFAIEKIREWLRASRSSLET